MSNNRGHSIQHKATEESKTKLIAELKKENHQLQRKVAKLQKYLQKALDSSAFVKEEEVTDEPQTPVNTNGCPNCGSSLVSSLKLPSGATIRACKNCTWRNKE
jgi:hypothetical protein